MNNINGINGYGNFGVGGGYVPQGKGEEAPQNAAAQQQAPNYEGTQIDPSKVMKYLAANNFFVVTAKEAAPAGHVDAATQARIEDYMANFERIYDIVVKEFGEEIAPDVMNVAMDHLMGMAA